MQGLPELTPSAAPTDINELRAKNPDLIHPSRDPTTLLAKQELQQLTRTHLILPYLLGDIHPSHIKEYAGGLLLALEKPANPDGSPGGLRPIICGEAGVAVSPTSPPPLSGVLFLKYSHLHTNFFCRQQVSRMEPPTVLRFFPPYMPHSTLTL